MKKFLGDKTAILILGGLSVLVVIYLIASLGGLELKPAKPFAYLQDTPAISPGGLPSWNGLFYAIGFFAVVLIILFFLLPREQRKKFLQALAWFVLAGLVIFLILSKLSLGRAVEQPKEDPGKALVSPIPGPTDTPMPVVPPSVFTPPLVSSWTSYLVALGLLLVISGIWVWFIWRKRKKGVPYEALAEIAQAALEEINAGKDWGDIVLNSYYRMNKSVADWRGIQRRAGMTPAEFADYLVSAHLPGEAVYRLTSLFERVRYGDKKSTHKDIQDAVGSLTAILDYCRGEK